MNQIQKRIELDEKYYGLELENGEIIRLRLGNWTDAGWIWDGNKSDILEFLVRISDSEIVDEFLEDMRKNRITLNTFRKQIAENIESSDDGLYALTGDNARWHFGDSDSIDEDSEVKGFFSYKKIDKKILDMIKENVWSHYKGVTYEEFIAQEGKKIKENLKKILQECTNLEEFLHEIRPNWYEIEESYFVMQSSKFFEAIAETVEELREEGVKI